MFFIHFSSPFSPLNTKCPWFKKKIQGEIPSFLPQSLFLPSYVLKILSRRFKDVCYTLLFIRHVLGVLFVCCWIFVVGVFYFKTSKALDILSTFILDFLAKDVFDY